MSPAVEYLRARRFQRQARRRMIRSFLLGFFPTLLLSAFLVWFFLTH